MRKLYIFTIILISGMMLTSCDDFLDVRPDSQEVESDLYSTPQGFEDAIYGVYGSMQVSSLYGKEMTWGLTDIMAQDLDQNITSSRALARYQYKSDNELTTRFDAVWKAAYTSIGYANNVLKNLEGHNATTLPLFNLYKGEMLAVRAMLHFDLLRFFCSTDETKRGIPYVTKYAMGTNEFKKVGEVYDLIIKDLDEAEDLLKTEEANITYPRNNAFYYKFQNYRETHCNYYGVLALKARVYWMRGDMAKAGEYAAKVVDSKKFPLVEPSEVKDVFAGRLSDRETIWGLYSNSYLATAQNYLYEQQSFKSYDPYYDATGTTHILPFEALYKLDVDATAQDYRYSNWFKISTASTRFIKTVDVYSIENNMSEDWQKRIEGINLFHVSEMYLIAAEAFLDTDYNRAVGYFNAETSSRGLSPLTQSVKLTKERIFNEYHKEMFGEGQVWYNMKRDYSDIKSNLDSKVIPGNEDIYVIPIPQDEFNYRN